MLPFMEALLQDMLLSLRKIFVKKDVLEAANTGYKLATVEINLSSNLISGHLIVLSTATKSLLKHLNLQPEKKISFLKECVEMLKATVCKIQERCPLKYSICINSSCLSPVKMIQNRQVCIRKFTYLVDKLYEGKWLDGFESEQEKKECKDSLVSVHHELTDKFNSFDYNKERLDEFLKVFLYKNKKYLHLWKVCLFIFTMFHGQSSVERGFSVNKELLVTNLTQHNNQPVVSL